MDMPLETFEKISQHFYDTSLIYLSGWGEPLLNKEIFEMVKLAKDSGSAVGFTTNGMLLTSETCKKLIELDLDILGISIAGATKKTHEEIRVGSNFDRLIKNIEILKAVKVSYGTGKPKIMLFFLMTKQNIIELPFMLMLAKELGADELVATNLSYAATPLHDEIKAFSHKTVNKSIVEKIQEAERKAKEHNVAFRSFPLVMREALVCEENPLNNVYVSCDGYVSPCVYLNLPIERIPRIFCGDNHTMQRKHFGNINQNGLLEIWEKEDYQLFREKYKSRSALLGDALPFNFDKLTKMDEWIETNSLPSVCENCYKAYGI